MQVRLHALRQLFSRQQQVLRRRAANTQPYVQVGPGFVLPCKLSWSWNHAIQQQLLRRQPSKV